MSTAKTDSIKMLFIGDVVARPGRGAVQTVLPALKNEHAIDVVIANVENLAGGKGIYRDGIYELIEAGVDYFTSGNHVFFRDQWEEVLVDESLGVIRPANYCVEVPGRGWIEFETNGHSVRLINLEGSHAMEAPVQNPFVFIDEFLDEHDTRDQIVILDFHAETTSEKRAFGFYIDGRVDICVGTHTHVPTADLQVLPGGTFYVSDLGMTGNLHSVLGVKKEIIIERYTRPYPKRFEWEYEGEKVLNAVLVDIAGKSNISDFMRLDQVIP